MLLILVKDEKPQRRHEERRVRQAPRKEGGPVGYREHLGGGDARRRNDSPRDEHRQVAPPEMKHIQPNAPLVVPVHEGTVSERHARHVADSWGPVADKRGGD